MFDYHFIIISSKLFCTNRFSIMYFCFIIFFIAFYFVIFQLLKMYFRIYTHLHYKTKISINNSFSFY